MVLGRVKWPRNCSELYTERRRFAFCVGDNLRGFGVLVAISVLILAARCGGPTSKAPFPASDSGTGSQDNEQQKRRPRFGLTAFSYDLTLDAYGDAINDLLGKTYSLMLEQSDMFVQWEDACVPWAELAADQPLNSETAGDWSHAKQSLALASFNGPIFVALAPTQHDRETINYDCASKKIDDGDYGRIESLVPGFRNNA